MPTEADVQISPVARLVATLRGRHWTSFLLELVLITVGILIALYIDAGIQERKDRAAEREYLSVLSRDLEQITVQLQSYLEFERTNTESAIEILRWLADQDSVSEYDSLRADLWTIGGRRTLRLVSAAYTDLLSTGNLQLIRDRELRDAILNFFAEVSRVQSVVEKNNTSFVDNLFLPFLIETGIAWAPSRNVLTIKELQVASDQLRDGFGDDLEALVDIESAEPTDPATRTAIQQMVVFRSRISSIGLVLGGSLKDQAAALQTQIDAALAAR